VVAQLLPGLEQLAVASALHRVELPAGVQPIGLKHLGPMI